MNLFLIMGLGLLAYLGLALYLYLTAPSLSELEAESRRPTRDTGFKVGASSEQARDYPLRIGPELWSAYRHLFRLTLSNGVAVACAFRLTQAFLVLVYPIRRLLFFRHLDAARKRVFVPLAVFNRLTSRYLGSMPLMTTPVLFLEDDAANNTLETRAASLIIGATTLWRHIRRGELVNMTLGMRCSDEVQYLFQRCAGLHELSRTRTPTVVAEHTDIEPRDYVLVFIGGHVYRVDVGDGEFTEDGKKRLLATLRAIVGDFEARSRNVPPPGLSLCTHVYDARQPELRYKYRDYFQTLNHALFSIALYPDAHPQDVNELATRHFAHPENCWNDKGIQLLAYANGKATMIARFKNYCLGSSIAKTGSFIQQEGRKHDLSGLQAQVDAGSVRAERIEHPQLDAREQEVIQFYLEQHRSWMRREPHIRQLSFGKRSINTLHGERIQADSVFQTCLHLAYLKVFGHFPIVSEAVFMGLFRKIFSSSMEFTGTSDMKTFSQRMLGLDVTGEIPHERLAADAQLPTLLLAAARSHHHLTRFAKHGYITPNRLYAWFRTFTFHPLRLVRLLAALFLPRAFLELAPVRGFVSLCSRFPLLSRLLAFRAFDMSSSHLPAMPGLSGGVLQNCNFDRVPDIVTPDIDLPELLGGVYKPRLLVHYSIYEQHMNISPLFFDATARARKDEFVQALEFYLRACASLTQATQQAPGAELSPASRAHVASSTAAA